MNIPALLRVDARSAGDRPHLVGVGHDLPATAAERVLDTLIKHLNA